MITTIKSRIVIGYAATLLVMLIAAIILSVNNRFVSEQVGNFIGQTLPAIDQLETLQTDAKQLVLIGYSRYGLTLEEPHFLTQKAQLSDSMKSILEQISSDNSSAMKKQLGELISAMDALSYTMSQDNVDWDFARKNLEQIGFVSNEFENSLRSAKSEINKDAQIRTQQISESQHSSQLTILILVVVMLGVTVIAFLLAQRHIANPISKLADRLDLVVTQRDLSAKLDDEHMKELRIMRNSIQNLLDMFDQGMREVGNAVSGIDDAVTSLASTSEQSEISVIHLQGEIKRLVAIMHDLEQDMGESLLQSQSTSQRANETAEQVKSGREQVKASAVAIAGLAKDIEQTASMLETLQQEGSNVSTVVRTIAEIADQTNLLALNAAIEAARAGDSGRGFAVVADEVRTLAVRTHQSTVEINAMLEKIVSSILSAVTTMSSNQEKAKQSVTLSDNLVSTLDVVRDSILSLVTVSEEASSIVQLSQEKVNEAKSGVVDFSILGDVLSGASNNVGMASSELLTLSKRLGKHVDLFKLS